MPRLPLEQAPPPSRQGGDVDDVLEAGLARQRYRSAERARLIQTPGAASTLLDESGNRDEPLRRMLERYKDRDFVRRIMRPELAPVIPAPDGSGRGMTHNMAAEYIGPNGTMPAMFPTVVHDRASGSLTLLPIEEAKRHALETGEYIPFKSIDEAIWASKNYKQIWGSRGSRPE